MKFLHDSYSKKSLLDIQKLLNDFENLSLEAKIVLKEIIETKHSLEDFNENKYSALVESIELDHAKIASLEYIENLGIEYSEVDGIKVIKKSNSAVRSYKYALSLGLFLLLFIMPSIIGWKELVEGEFDVFKLIVVSLLTAITLTGVNLIYKAVDRWYLYNGFGITKNSNSIELNYRPESKLVHKNYSKNAILKIVNEKEKASLIIVENNEEDSILTFQKNGYILSETLKNLAVKFNN